MRDLHLPTFKVEAVLTDFLLRAEFKPLGPAITFLNDRTRSLVPFNEVEIFPLAADRQVPKVKQSPLVVNKSKLLFMSMLEREDVQKIRLLATTRSIIFYTNHFLIQGKLHVSTDAHEHDLLDDAKDFFPISEATVYPLRSFKNLTRKVPLLLIQRSQIHAYHVQTK